MRPFVLIAAVAVLIALIASVAGFGLLDALQVAPGAGSVKLFERTGGTANDGISPMTDAQWSASQRAANTGASLRLFSSAPVGTQSWTVTYVLTCAGVNKGSGSATVGSWYDGTKSPLWFTIPNSIDRPAIEAGDLCFVRVTTFPSSGLSWRTGTTGGLPNDRHDLVVWGETLTPDEGPPPPPVDEWGKIPRVEPTEEDEEPEPPGDGAAPDLVALAILGLIIILIIMATLAALWAAFV